MKKILLLGGSAQQIIAIDKAKEMGYYTILCDYLEDNPGQYVCDKFYLVSTTNKEAILEVAMKEKIDGILAYASDPAAPTAAYVAEKLKLATNPYKSVDILCNKDKFRKFLEANDFNAPKSKSYSSIDDAMKDIKLFHLPVIIKPVDSSGSKGATVINQLEKIEEAFLFAFSFSRAKRIVVEEFIEKKHPYLIGGDIFVKDGNVVLWGLMNCHRDNGVNPLVPVGKSYPLKLSKLDEENVKLTIQRLVTKLSIKNGALNVEAILDKQGKVWLIDIGPRNGGNMIPDLINYIFNIDVIKLSIKIAMNEPITIYPTTPNKYYATYNLHSNKNGILSNIHFKDEIEKFIIKKCIYKKIGNHIEYFDNASKALGIIFLKFSTEEEMFYYLTNINSYIDISVN